MSENEVIAKAVAENIECDRIQFLRKVYFTHRGIEHWWNGGGWIGLPLEDLHINPYRLPRRLVTGEVVP